MSIKTFLFKKRSIRTLALVALSGLLVISIVLIALISVSALTRAGQNAQEVSGEVLRSQIEDFLVNSTKAIATQNDLLLERIQQDASYVAYYAADILSQPAVYSDTVVWQAREAMDYAADGQFMNGEQDRVSVFVPNFVTVDDDLLREINLTSYLDLVFESIFENSADLVAIYLGSQSEITRFYPNIGLGNVVPADFQITQRPWYLAAITDNPSRSVVWSSVYEDATGQGLLVTASAPVYDANGVFYGVIGIDVQLAELVTTISAGKVSENSYTFLIDAGGNSIVLPEVGYQQILGRAPQENEYGAALAGVESVFGPVITQMIGQKTGFESVEVDGQEYFVAFAPMVNTNWSLANVAPASELLGSVNALENELLETSRRLAITRIVPAGLLILAAALFVSYQATGQLVKPLRALVNAVQEISGGKWETRVPQTPITEIDTLSRGFEVMTGRLRTNLEELEQRVAERTVTLERRAMQLEAAAEVGHSAANIRDLDQLLNEVTNLISKRFGFYHVGVFLLDEDEQYAELRAANSSGGKRMLARRHKLKIGTEGIVGYVTESSQPRIALDVGRDAVFFNNPDLPETRSEMALPLKTRDRLLGALDVQSMAEAAFADDDIAVLQVLADQIAVAIENAYLFSESQAALETAQRAYGELSQEAWRDLLRTQKELAFSASTHRDVIVPASGWNTAMIQASITGQLVRANERTIVIPILLRDEVLGVVQLQKNEEMDRWSDAEIELMDTMVDQLELALESARLYSDTQRQAERERLTAALTDKIHRAFDMDSLMRTLVDEIGNALGASSTFVQLGTPAPTETSEPA